MNNHVFPEPAIAASNLILAVNNIEVVYDRIALVLKGVSLKISAELRRF